MALSLNKARLSPIAIDFGADTLKLLQLVPGRPPQLAAAAAARLPVSSRNNPADRAAAIASTLKTLLTQAPFKGRRAICSIPAFQTLVQNFEVAGGDANKVEEQVHAQLRERLHVEPKAMVVRVVDCTPADRPPGAKRDVVCFAAGRQVVMQHIDICKQAKLEVAGMHAEPMALLEATRHAGRDETRAVIDIGAATTKLLIIRRGELAFAKSILAGGEQVTRRLAAEQGIEYDEARRLRCERSPVLPGDPKPAAAPTGVSTSRLVAALDTLEKETEPEPEAPAKPASEPPSGEMVRCLIDELRLSVRYYAGRCPDHPIDKLVFVGGEANDTAACQKIAQALRIAAQLGDPLGGVVHVGQSRSAGVDLDRPQPAWAVARGLVCSEANV